LQQFRSIPEDKDVAFVVLDWRVAAYHDPVTEKLDAPGFGNNLERLIADQSRRTQAVIDTAKKLGIF
jgi:hypothetical protein